LSYVSLSLLSASAPSSKHRSFYQFAFLLDCVCHNDAPVMGCLHDPANVQQVTCILNTFAGSLLDVCWIV